MTDTLTPTERSKRMARISAKDTKPEMIVRRIVRSLGYGYRLHRKDLPGKPDLAFFSRKKAIFVHGCFWHRHADSTCKLARLPKSRLDFWLPKLEGNARRDEKKIEQLREIGWNTLVIWECELKDTASLMDKIASFLSNEID